MKSLIFKKKSAIFLAGGLFLAGFFVLAGNACAASPAIDYAPNLWFSAEEKYFPANPLDFYYENGHEISGELAKNKYDKLSIDEKLNHFTVFYHIFDSGDRWVYQYWFFYVFNDFTNEHYGDWESVFVFVDKDSNNIVKVVGTGHARKLFDTEIFKPKNNHVWSFVGKGSHANCVDEDDSFLLCSFRWSIYDDWQKGGQKVNHTEYNLIEINSGFVDHFNSAITLEQSPILGVFPFRIGEKESYLLPFSGSPPTHAWAQSNFNNPEEIEPIFSSNYAKNQINKAVGAVSGFFNSAVGKISSIFKKSKPVPEASIVSGLASQEQNTGQNYDSSGISGVASLPLPVPAPVTMPVPKPGLSSNPPVSVPKPKETFVNNQGSASEAKPEQKTQDSTNEPEKNDGLNQSPPSGLPFFIGGGPGLELENPAPTSTPPVSATTSWSVAINHPVDSSVFGLKDDLSTSTDDLQIELIGSSSPGLIDIFVNSTTSAYSVNSDGNWKQIISLDPGANLVEVKLNGVNDSVNLFFDAEAPLAISDLSINPVGVRGSIELSWTAPSDNAFSRASQYIIKYSTSSPIVESNWHEADVLDHRLAPGLAGDIENLLIEKLVIGHKYYWAVKSIDEVGNVSDISNVVDSQASALADHVVINEIQIDEKEFVELYNPTLADVELTGWHLSYYEGGDLNDPSFSYQFPDKAIIPAKGYYLIDIFGYFERYGYVIFDWHIKDDFHRVLDDRDGSIAIFSQNPQGKTIDEARTNIVDAVGWGDAGFVYEGAVCQAPQSGRSIVRRIDGWDSDNNGSDFIESDWPALNNSKSEQISVITEGLVIDGNKTWAIEQSPYLLDSMLDLSPAAVEKGAVLTIEPGVEIIGVHKGVAGLAVRGKFIAQGAVGNEIVFKPMGRNCWSGIIFDNAEAVIENVVFNRGGNGTYVDGLGNLEGAIWAINSKIKIKNVVFEDNSGPGLYLTDSELDISNSVFRDNNVFSAVINGGLASVDNCQFEDNHSGIKITGQALASISNSVFKGNYYSIRIEGADVDFNNIDLSDNNYNGVFVSEYSVFERDVVWRPGLTYIIGSNKFSQPRVAIGAALTIEPGVVVKMVDFDYPALLVEGELIALGNASSSALIVFTSLKDDEYGNDTNNDGDASVAEFGDWQSIEFKPGSIGQFDDVVFRYNNKPLEIDSQAQVDLGSVVYGP